MVVLERTILDNRFTRVMTVAFLASTNEFDFVLLPLLTKLDLRGTEVTKYGKMSLLTQLALQFFSYSDATANHHDIDIVRRSFEKNITNISPNHVTFDTHCIGHMTDLAEDFLIQYLC